jgi:UDP-glucose:(heptosyl)LPS alpha-1,3-glucosyltransferase
MYELVRGARDHVDFTIVSITLAEDLKPFVRWRKVPALRRPFAMKFLIFFAIAPIRYRRRHADIVHTLGAVVPRRADLMAVHFCHAAYRAVTRDADLEASQPLLRRLNVGIAFRIGLLAERALTRPPWARHGTAVSSGGARELSRFYPDLPVTVVPNGVDQTRFRPDASDRAVTRAQAGATDDEVVALFVGGRWSQKGLETTIRGLAAANPRLTVPLSLWVAGSGNIKHYQALADDLGVGGQVRFVGYVSDTERLYAAADIFVLPSSYETFCMVAYEAASSGLPVVATAVNGVADLLQGTDAGVLIDATAESVGAALADLAGDPDRRTKMGAAGRRRAADFTWAASVAQTIEVYHQVIGSDRSGRHR